MLASARGRILASYLALLVFSSAASFVALQHLLVTEAGHRVDNALIQETREFRQLVSGRDPRTGERFGTDVRAIFDVYLSRNVPGEGEAFFTFVGGRLYRSNVQLGARPGEAERMAAPGVRDASHGGELEIGDKRFRFLAVPIRRGGRTLGVFAVRIDLEGELEEVASTVRIAAGVSLGVLLFASLLAWLIAGRVLAPLRLLGNTARSITDTDLTRRIPVRGHDELAELARAFNGMLDRLESAFSSQKAFISDAGHELRTPITIIRGHLELLGDDPDERHETMELVTDELDRMSRLVDDLLVLAKAERPDFLRVEELDLDLLTSELFAKASALAPRDWRMDHAGTGRIAADRQRLTQAVLSLAHNAVQHTSDGDRVALGGELRDGTARLWVRDSGPGVAPTDRERIFERFVRGGSSRHEGAGLGLAIVRAIAEAHGGCVELDSRPGSGAIFTIVVPAQPPGAPAESRETLLPAVATT